MFVLKTLSIRVADWSENLVGSVILGVWCNSGGRLSRRDSPGVWCNSGGRLSRRDLQGCGVTVVADCQGEIHRGCGVTVLADCQGEICRGVVVVCYVRVTLSRRDSAQQAIKNITKRFFL